MVVTGEICDGPNLSFINCPPKKSRPSGHKTTKRSDAVKFVIDKFVKQTNASLNNVNGSPAPLWDALEKSLLEASNKIRMIAAHQALMANHQIMMQAPGELQQKYFNEVYASILLLQQTVVWKKKQGKLCCVQEKQVQKRKSQNVILRLKEGILFHVKSLCQRYAILLNHTIRLIG